MKSSNTRKKATTARTKPAAARAKAKRTSTRKPTGPSAVELIQTADQLGLKLYAAEGLTNFRQRAMTSLKRIEAAGMTYDSNQPEDWILLLQSFRDEGKMSPDEIFFGIDDNVGNIVLDDPEVKRLYEASEAKHREAGFGEDETWPDEKPPAAVQKIWDAYWERYYLLKAAILRHHGEDEMADLLEADPDAYEARVEAGKVLFEKRHDALVAAGIPGQVK